MRRTLAGNRYSLLIGERRLLHGHPFFILSAGCGRQEVECSEAAAIRGSAGIHVKSSKNSANRRIWRMNLVSPTSTADYPDYFSGSKSDSWFSALSLRCPLPFVAGA